MRGAVTEGQIKGRHAAPLKATLHEGLPRHRKETRVCHASISICMAANSPVCRLLRIAAEPGHFAIRYAPCETARTA